MAAMLDRFMALDHGFMGIEKAHGGLEDAVLALGGVASNPELDEVIRFEAEHALLEVKVLMSRIASLRNSFEDTYLIRTKC